jgi:hypothetical protein
VWENQKSGHRAWLKDWLAGMSSTLIANKEKLSPKTVRREINWLLANSPKVEILPNQNAHLLIDGTYFKRTNCLILYFDNDLKYFQLLRYSTREIKDEIIKDLRTLKRSGVNVASATADGKNAVKSALKKVFPKATFQRCLVHIQRYGETYITQRPKTKAGVEMQEIIKRLNTIDCGLAKMTWLGCFSNWKRLYGDFLKERSYGENHWWYTHRNLRRVAYHIDRALPDMWRYLDNKSIPKDTNALEGRFTDLKQKFKNHRGLKKEKRESYFTWYIYYKNHEKKN